MSAAPDQPATGALLLGKVAWDAREAILTYQSDDPEVTNETLEQIQAGIGLAILDALIIPEQVGDTEQHERLQAARATIVQLRRQGREAVTPDLFVLDDEVTRLTALAAGQAAALQTIQGHLDDSDGHPVTQADGEHVPVYVIQSVLDSVPRLARTAAAAHEVLDAHRCDESAERAYRRAVDAEARAERLAAEVSRQSTILTTIGQRYGRNILDVTGHWCLISGCDGTCSAPQAEVVVAAASEGAPITIYGASDDLLEVEGAVTDEFDALSGATRVRLTAPDGGTLDVIGQYGRPGSALEWSITVEAVGAYPSWPIRFHERPDSEGDPAVTVDAPVGTTVQLVTA